MRRAVLCLTILGAAWALEAGAAERPASLARFRSWLIGCDNRRDCRAIGLSASETPRGVLFVDRAAEGDAAPMLSIAFHSLSGPGAELRDGTPVEFAADGTHLGRVAIGAGLVPQDEERSVFELRDAGVRQAVLDAARRARLLIVTPAGVGDPLEISLQGASAALLFMDERQNRIGTVTALTRRGRRPAAVIPAPPALPQPPQLQGDRAWRPVPSELPDTVRQRIRPSGTECSSVENQPTNATAIGRVGADLVLIRVLCLRGAYNESYRFHLWNDRSGRVAAIAFPSPHGVEGPSPLELLTNPEFDAQALALRHFSKGRGLGDCGTTGRWRWDGRSFVLTSFDTMPQCQGLMPQNWLRLFRSQ